ncbi:hypothetical protein [Marinobacter sp. LV10R520-4]|uniref:hypothetical protein n=1 Tax=Marinobacter sp. LV10R520-4 TaxID=1761796 RepID=UPI001E54645D|nr:hypothetical protein [Marinobacter sp. LV10R520-4]
MNDYISVGAFAGHQRRCLMIALRHQQSILVHMACHISSCYIQGVINGKGVVFASTIRLSQQAGRFLTGTFPLSERRAIAYTPPIIQHRQNRHPD